MLLEGATARAIAQRGDATYSLEYSEDDSTYTPLMAGWARDWQMDTVIDASGTSYRASCSLKDAFWRLEEAHVNLQSAFDWKTVADSVDTILKASGMLAVGTPSATLQDMIVPGSPTGRAWRYAPNLGDSGVEALEAVLTHTRTQRGEWILRYDYATDNWVTEPRASSTVTGALTLTPYSDDRDPDNGVFCYTSAQWRPEPPEANVIQIAGVSDPDSAAIRYVSPPCENHGSITDAASADYLGRTIVLLGTLAEAPTQREVNLMARRLYDAVAHRRVRGTLMLTDWHASLTPNVYCTVERDDDETLALVWIKRVTVRITQGQGLVFAGGAPTVSPGYLEQVTLEVDTQWERELHG